MQATALLLLLCSTLLPCMVEAKDSSDPEILIVFLFFGTFLGAVTTYILSRYAPAVPYTVVVFLEGLLLAAISDNVDLGNFTDSADNWSDIDAELILFLFLPVLIFGEAMSLKWHHVKGVFMQSLLLAGPGVLIGAALMGCFAKFCLPYGWSWNLAMVFGSILSATDPVAVVALLKDAGASPKLTILIIGESLMNDGTAMVLFNLFFNMMKGDTYDFGGIVAFFASMAIGAPLLGIAFGLVSVYLMGKANRSLNSEDTTIQIAITFCCAYLVFFTAEYECEISGVLACCGAGCVFAWKAPPLILEPETMHHVWGMIEWVANTIIFLLAGLIIGKETLSQVDASDWGHLILLYIVLSLIRVFVVFVLYPALSVTGLKCSRKDAVFVSWAGLRGALAMSLALIVKKSDEININNNDADRIFFFVGGIAAITILINAVFSKKVLEFLGLLTTEETPDKVLVLNQVQKRLRKKSLDLVMKLAKEMNLDDPSSVVKYNSLLKNYIRRSGVQEPWMTDAMRSVSGVRLDSTNSNNITNSTSAFLDAYGFETSFLVKNSRQSSEILSNNHRQLSRASDWLLNARRCSTDPVIEELQAYIRTVFLEIVRVQYWKFIEEGKLPREGYATQTLLYSIENALDRVQKVRLRDWKYLKNEMDTAEWHVSLLAKVPSWVPYAEYLQDVLASVTEKRAIYILTSCIEAHEIAQEKIVSFMGHARPSIGEEPQGDNLTPEEVIVLQESKDVVKEAKKRLAAMNPKIVASVVTKQAALILLWKQKEFIENLIHEGLLDTKDGDIFFEKFKKDELSIRKERRADFKMHVEEARTKRTTMSQQSFRDLTTAGGSVFMSSHSQLDVKQPLISNNEKY